MARQAAGLGLVHERIAIDRADWEASYRAAFARLASEGVERIVTGDITPAVWPWLGEATAATGLMLETPLADEPDPAALLDFLDDAVVVATVSGMREDCYRPTFLGRPIGRALLREHGFEDPEAFHPCGERGEFHTVVTAYGDMRFLAEDAAAFAHVERDGIWALGFPAELAG
jgi:diphthamide synthase (EF-2-diphthine--ammonia ligase)